jgi:peptidoglycan/LPS O-acetylase OafA/YrhL
MRRPPWGLYPVAVAVLIVGLATVGVPASTLLTGAFVLVCPVMMMVMMGGMHGAGRGADLTTKRPERTPADLAGQPVDGRPSASAEQRRRPR